MIHSIKEIDLARGCLRKWAAKYLHRLPDPKHPNAQDGIDMHELLRAMCARGPSANVNPESKVGAWARALYPLTPTGVLCELEQTFDLFGRTASFRIDFTLPDFSGFGDWKSITMGPWAAPLTPTTIQDDLQANWESYGFMRVFGRTEVPVRWLYVNKKTCQPWHVDGRFTLAGTEAWLRANALPTVKLVEAMRSITPAPAVQAVPHDPGVCEGVGKFCAFLGACQMRTGLVPIERLRAFATQEEIK